MRRPTWNLIAIAAMSGYLWLVAIAMAPQTGGASTSGYAIDTHPAAR
jgi:hypothetical protein